VFFLSSAFVFLVLHLVVPVARVALFDCLRSNFAQATKTMADAIMAPIIPMGVPRRVHQFKLHQGHIKDSDGYNKRNQGGVISLQWF